MPQRAQRTQSGSACGSKVSGVFRAFEVAAFLAAGLLAPAVVAAEPGSKSAIDHCDEEKLLTQWIQYFSSFPNKQLLTLYRYDEGAVYEFDTRRFTDPLDEGKLIPQTVRLGLSEATRQLRVEPPSREKMLECAGEAVLASLKQSGTFDLLTASAPRSGRGRFTYSVGRRGMGDTKKVLDAEEKLKAFVKAGQTEKIFSKCLARKADPLFHGDIDDQSSASIVMEKDSLQLAITPPDLKPKSRKRTNLTPVCHQLSDNWQWKELSPCPRELKNLILSEDQNRFFLSRRNLAAFLKEGGAGVRGGAVRFCGVADPSGASPFFEICNGHTSYQRDPKPKYCTSERRIPLR